MSRWESWAGASTRHSACALRDRWGPQLLHHCQCTTAAQVARGHTTPGARHPQLTRGHPPNTATSPAHICGAQGGSLLFFIRVYALCTSKDSTAKSTREARSIHISKTRNFARSPPGGLFTFLPLLEALQQQSGTCSLWWQPAQGPPHSAHRTAPKISPACPTEFIGTGTLLQDAGCSDKWEFSNENLLHWKISN